MTKLRQSDTFLNALYLQMQQQQQYDQIQMQQQQQQQMMVNGGQRYREYL